MLYWDKIPILALLVAIWLLAHPYYGIWHDGQLYAAQAIQRLNPAAFRDDLFFTNGSQDQFTLFTPIYGWLIGIAGLNAAAIGLLLLFQALWFIGYWALCRQFLEGRWLYLAVILAFGMGPRYYGGLKIFAYAETFLTARLAAEATGLIAMAIYFSGRRTTGLLTALLATALHPLIGGWVAGLLGVLRFGWRAPALCGAFAALLLTIINPSMIASLLAPMDVEWRTLVLERSPALSPGNWKSEDWSRMGMALSLLLAAAALTTGAARSLWLWLAGVGLLALAASWIGTVVFHSALITQLQPWRALWLITALQWIAVAQFARTLWPDKTGRLWLAWFLTAWLLKDSFGGALGLALSLAFWSFRDRKPLSESLLTKWLNIATVVVLTVTFLTWLPSAVMDASLEGSRFLWNDTLLSQIFTGVMLTEIALLPILAIWWLSSKNRDWQRFILLSVITSGLLGVSIIRWDQREEIQHFVETIASHPENRPFSDNIKLGDLVYWPQQIELAWFGLKTAHYVSRKQTAGMVFDRDTALEAKRRAHQVIGPSLDGETNDAANTNISLKQTPYSRFLQGEDKPIENENELIRLCHDPILDFVVLPTHFPGMSSGSYAIPGHKKPFQLYNCGLIRQRDSNVILVR